MIDENCQDCAENLSFTILNSAFDKKTSHIIKEYLVGEVEKYIDYIFVGNTGIDTGKFDTKTDLGSVAGEIIRHTKLNCMFICRKTKL